MKYLIPYSYGFATRAKGSLNKISFLAIFVFPLFLIGLTSGEHELAYFLRFVATLTALYCVYEIGYMQNDIYTTRHEKNPTIRLPMEQHETVQKNAVLLIASRALYAMILLSLLFIAGELYVFSFASMLLMLVCVFGMHNAIRGRANALTYLLLCFLKYAAIPVLFLSANPQKLSVALLAVFFSFVLPRSMEHASKPKYKLPLFSKIGDHDAFRLRYYAVLSAVSCIAWLTSARFSLLAILSLWFLAFRSFVFVALRRHSGLRHG